MNKCPDCPDPRFFNGYGCDLCKGSGIKSEYKSEDPRSPPPTDPCKYCGKDSLSCEICM